AAETKVKELGGLVKTAVTQSLTYLVTNTPESGSSKNRKAAQAGIKIIGEDEFIEKLTEAAGGYEKI
ncbi:MAG: hypothetical protein LBJ86_07450, partial [Spirochaetaceae bacterium]|nr:hypothetical protein [Spirochaetaceae bacterium]